MPRLKLAIALPIVQLTAACVLARMGLTVLYTPTSRLLMWGISAPAMPARKLGDIPIWIQHEPNWITRPVLGFDLDDLAFFVGVVCLWHLVGRALDRRRRGEPEVQRRWKTVAAYLSLLPFSLVCGWGGYEFYSRPAFNNPNYPLIVAMFWGWSLALAATCCVGLVRTLRRDGWLPPAGKG
jgi:hypothetical protein